MGGEQVWVRAQGNTADTQGTGRQCSAEPLSANKRIGLGRRHFKMTRWAGAAQDWRAQPSAPQVNQAATARPPSAPCR